MENDRKTAPDLAFQLGLDPKYLRHLIRHHRLVPSHVPGQRYWLTAADVQRIIDHPAVKRAATRVASHWLLWIRVQAWFRPFVELDALEDFPAAELTKAPGEAVRGATSEADQIYAKVLLGRGPLHIQLPATMTLYAEHGEVDYPTFTPPGQGPPGAAVKGGVRERAIELSVDDATFLVELGRFSTIPADIANESGALDIDSTKGWPDTPQSRFVLPRLIHLRTLAERVVGAYALYQHSYVWERLETVESVACVDIARDHQIVFSTHPQIGDPAIPTLLNPRAGLDGGRIRDAVVTNLSLITSDNSLGVPLELLAMALHQEHLEARFVMLFWILESVTNQLTDQSGDDLVALAGAIRRLLEEHEPDLMPLFRTKKSDLQRRPIRERILEALAKAGIDEPDPAAWVPDAVKIRNKMSHGDVIDEFLLRRTEVLLRFAVWQLFRSYLLERGFKPNPTDE